jgi:hypothetical protein
MIGLLTRFRVQPGAAQLHSQLSGPGTCPPAARAAAGGGSCAVIQTSHVGPEGGQVLVRGTVDVLKALWPAP